MLITDTRSCPFQKDSCSHGECALWVPNTQNAEVGDCAFVRVASELTKSNNPSTRTK